MFGRRNKRVPDSHAPFPAGQPHAGASGVPSRAHQLPVPPNGVLLGRHAAQDVGRELVPERPVRARPPVPAPVQYRPAAANGRDDKRNRRLPGEQSIPTYTPSIAARSIDGHLLRNGHDVFAWYRLAPQRWSFRSDSQR